ncbi:MAG: hypothetical protein HC875_15360 [Anaerolineales bacterium]|nr:hypothetical protein [Anaerolineales bacterium]
MMQQNTKAQFVVCVRNDNYLASLELRKIYQVLPDPRAAEYQRIRVIDESGEDYLYPENYFVPIRLPQRTVEKIFQVAE